MSALHRLWSHKLVEGQIVRTGKVRPEEGRLSWKIRRSREMRTAAIAMRARFFDAYEKVQGECLKNDPDGWKKIWKFEKIHKVFVLDVNEAAKLSRRVAEGLKDFRKGSRAEPLKSYIALWSRRSSACFEYDRHGRREAHIIHIGPRATKIAAEKLVRRMIEYPSAVGAAAGIIGEIRDMKKYAEAAGSHPFPQP